MKKSLFLFLFVLFASINLYSQKGHVIPLQISLDSCNAVPPTVLLINFSDSSNISYCLISWCDYNIFTFPVTLEGEFGVVEDLKARLVSGNPANNEFLIVFSSSITNEDKFELLKYKETENAFLRESFSSGQSRSDMLANEYFNYSIKDSKLVVSKRKAFTCIFMKLINSQGKIIQEFNFDNSNYIFYLNKYKRGVYYLSFQANVHELIKKIEFKEQK